MLVRIISNKGPVKLIQLVKMVHLFVHIISKLEIFQALAENSGGRETCLKVRENATKFPMSGKSHGILLREIHF